MKFLFFIVVFFDGYQTINAQTAGGMQFIGHNFLNDKELIFTEIKMVSKKGITTIETGKSNSFKLTLAYGQVYDIYFTNTKTQKMFLRVFADIPSDKQTLKTTYELNIPFFTKDNEMVDTAKFREPFHQIVFDGKSKFVDDTVYMNRFLKQIVRVSIVDSSGYFKVKTAQVKQYFQMVGKLSLDNDKRSPLKNNTVELLNKNKMVIAKVQTSNHGIFVFTGIDRDETHGLTIQLSGIDNPNNNKIKLENILGEVILNSGFVNGTYQFINSPQNKMVEKLTDKDFKFNIGGKVVLRNGDVKKIGSGKTVVLLSGKNNVVQTVTTDVFGNFLFPKILPSSKYTIAFDTTDYGKFKPELYSVKDKFIAPVDSVNSARFNYCFTSDSSPKFNNLLLDDSELKMNVKGRIYGDNKNNPLSDLKMMLLNDKFNIVDSATTNAEGNFAFNYMPYNRQFIISANNENNILEAFNNILVFDNASNLIKIVSNVKGQKFNYKPLALEQSRISEIFIDEPWLKIVNRKKNNSSEKTIITENILFDFDKALLLEPAKQTLDKIALVMQLNANFTVELGAHCDSKGNDAYNFKLSEERAAAAKNYLISKGVDTERLTAKGYGETTLINNCGNALLCADSEHAVNRRLEFTLIFNK